MRKLSIACLPAFAVLAAVPAAAQVSGHVSINIPIGRPAVIHAMPHREVIVRGYDPYLFGDWENYYDLWSPITVYFYDGHYYDYPIVSWAQPVVVYRYRNQIFFPPRDARFDNWRRERIVAPIARPRPEVIAPRRDYRGYGRVQREPTRVVPDRRGNYGGRYVAPPSRGGGRPGAGGRANGGSHGGGSHRGGGHGR